MRSGDLRDLIDIQRPTFTPPEPLPTYATVAADVPANVMAKAGQETAAAQQIGVRRVYDIRIRYYPGLSEDWRIVFEGMNLDIQSVINPDGKRIEHQLVCWWRGENTQ